MIDVQVNATFPEAKENGLQEAMKQVSAIMYSAIRQNFIEGGRPIPWQPLKRPNKSGGILPLWGSGGLFNAVKSGSGDDYAWVSAPNTIHQEGGRIPEVSLDPMGGRVMVFEMDGHLIFTYHHRAFNIPARPYMVLPDEDLNRILQLIPNALIGEPEAVD